MSFSGKEPAGETLKHFKETHNPTVLTDSNGMPLDNKSTVLTVGPRGPMLLQDVAYLDEMAHFDRERIPERVVHAKGAGAHGYFECSKDISNFTKACVFNEPGKRTPLFIRFSQVALESGSPDTVRDPRGFAIKMYTEEGNWDLVANNTPIFFIRDPMLFPSFIHALKRNPKTHTRDLNALWDFWSLKPESIHQVMFLFGDRGITDGYRYMNGYGSHTFRFVNKDGNTIWCKFHIKSNQGIKTLSQEEANKLAGIDPDYALRDLYNAIERGEYPEWRFCIQIMTDEEAHKVEFNPFDVTKVWPHAQFPLMEIGKIVLNRNPDNYFAEVEQVAFSPSNVIPGIEFSPDKMLQGRLFSYPDTHFHRLGPNYRQIPINCPYRTVVHNSQKDGLMCVNDNQKDAPVHHPNSFNGPTERLDAKQHTFYIQGLVDRHDATDDDNYTQPRMFWTKVLDDSAKKRLITNMCVQLKDCLPEIQQRVIAVFGRVHPDFQMMLQEELWGTGGTGSETEKQAQGTFEKFGEALKDALIPSH